MDIGFTEEQELLRRPRANSSTANAIAALCERAWPSRRRSPTNFGKNSPSRAGSASSTRKKSAAAGSGSSISSC